MVIRSGVTSYDAFNKAYNALKVLDINLTGIIINGSDSSKKYLYKNRYKYNSKNYSQYY